MYLSTYIDKNIEQIENLFQDCSDFKKRKFEIGKEKINVYMAFIEKAADNTSVDDLVVENLVRYIRTQQENEKLDFDLIKFGAVARIDVTEAKKLDELEKAILRGDCILLIDGYDTGIIVASTKWPSMGVNKSETEASIFGSNQAFTDSLRTNVALLRHIIKSSSLKVKNFKIGSVSDTDVEVLYIENVVRPQILKQIEAQLKALKVDGLMDSGVLEQLIEKNWKSVFPQLQLIERTDKAAAELLEGRIVILVDNSAFAIILPTTLNNFYQTSGDYYERWQVVSFIRILRYIGGVIAIALPGLYIAITLYHPAMIETALLLKMAGSRQNVPISGVVEVVAMEIAFELLREAGIRLPSAIGSTIGIVGGIVIGQAVVDAGIVSPLVVIVVSITAIATFTIPSVSITAAYRLIKFVIIFFSAILGLYGFWVAVLIVLIHLVSLKSYNIPYMYPFVSGGVNEYSDLKDSIIRFPSFMIKKHSIFVNPKEKERK